MNEGIYIGCDGVRDKSIGIWDLGKLGFLKEKKKCRIKVKLSGEKARLKRKEI